MIPIVIFDQIHTFSRTALSALNHLAVRYPATYAKAAEELAGNVSLTPVEVRPSPLSSTPRIVACIFSYT